MFRRRDVVVVVVVDVVEEVIRDDLLGEIVLVTYKQGL